MSSKIKNLVIIFGETRAHKLTFDNLKKNVIDELNADLCICIGVKPDYDYDNPFYKLAKYKFIYNETGDYGHGFEEAYNIISKNRPKYELLNDKIINLNEIINNSKVSYYKDIDIDDIPINDNDENFIIIDRKLTEKEIWKNTIYETRKKFIYKKHLYWRHFLQLKYNIWGGVKNDYNDNFYSSGGIILFLRWFLLEKIIENDLINKYDRFILTRSDFIYQLPHPKMEIMNDNYIWIPNSEQYGGYTDRHAVLSKKNIKDYLNIFNNFVLKSNQYFMKMKNYKIWNIEQLIAFNLQENKLKNIVKDFPYIMYTVRNIDDANTSGIIGNYNEKLGYFIKYKNEYELSSIYKNEYEKYNITLNNFYSNEIFNINTFDLNLNHNKMYYYTNPKNYIFYC